VLAVALAGALVVLQPGADAVAGPATGTYTAAAVPRTVTLITGDRVVVYGPDRVDVQHGPGRERVKFVIRKLGGHLQVIPADAVAMLQARQLDLRLFDVTTLLEFGYDRRGDVPLIVAQSGATARSLAARPRVPGAARVVRDLPGIRGMAARVDRSGAGTFWRDLSAHRLDAAAPKVWLDGLRQPVLEQSVPQVGAPAAWASGFTGEGVTVAVVDTGVDTAHPDLAGKVVASRSFVEFEDELDRVGHGTHVASTVAGTGAASGGRYKGVAPGAKLVGAKVCVSFGCAESWILAGMHWAVTEQRAQVVNMSLGGADSPGTDPVEQAVEDLTAQYGALFVVAAGNAGGDRTVGSPASADAALAVGAVDKQDTLAAFSSRGPRVGDSALKPDISAPGVDITAALSKDSGRGAPGEQYMTISGTSMATPHVAGAAAILVQRRPGWTPEQVKAALMASAAPNPQIGVFAQGAGRLDVAGAVNQTLTTAPASVSFGVQRWPHDDDTAVTKTVSYRNVGTAAVTLNLSVEANGPAGLFGVSRSTVTVPAGGTASVDLTADTRVAGPDGFLGGHLVASAGGTAVARTPFGVEKEVESYDVTFAHTNRAGQPTAEYFTSLIALDGSGVFDAGSDADGTVEVRLPKGRYSLNSNIFDGDAISDLFAPVLDVRGPQRIELDARTAKPMSAQLPRSGLVQFWAAVLFAPPEVGGAWVGPAGESYEGMFIATVGDPRAPGTVTKVDGKWAEPGPDGSLDDSRTVYNLSWTVRDRAITGFHRVVRERDLATVRANYLAGIPGGVATSRAGGWAEGIPFAGGAPLSFHPPFTRTEYYGGTDDIRWDHTLSQRSESGDASTVHLALNVRYRAGRAYTETWNQAVFGPAMPGGYDPAETGWAVRAGDRISTNLPLFSDGAGRAGISTGEGTVKLFRNGVLVREVDTVDAAEFVVPPEPARYRLEATVSRGAPFTLSTRVSAAWEFNSARTPPDRLTPLALSAVRFSPKLDAENTAPAGRTFSIPISTQAQLGSAATPTRSLSVEVSYDDGQTWRPVELRRTAGAWTAVVRHPAGTGFVSLRAKATDRSGNTVTETIIRAYRIA
jgi:subtilisin family serine protease